MPLRPPWKSGMVGFSTNGSFSTLTFSLVKSLPWLNVTPTSGVSTGDVRQITVQFASTGLVPGIYQDTLIVTNTLGDTLSASIPVTLTVFDVTATPTFVPAGNAIYLTKRVRFYFLCHAGPQQFIIHWMALRQQSRRRFLQMDFC